MTGTDEHIVNLWREVESLQARVEELEQRLGGQPRISEHEISQGPAGPEPPEPPEAA